MVRTGKDVAAATNPEADERKRLKALAISKNILSDVPAAKAKAKGVLSPSKTVVKHHGRDLLRKSNRKNRFLFSFPGLLAPISGGKIGDLKDLGSKNPVLYLDFPQGQMKLFGTIVYPKNRYLTLQFSKGGKNVMCEDYFDTMIVFSDAWWIGRKEENPEENRLEFPVDLNVGQQGDIDFKGGAGSTSERTQGVKPSGVPLIKQQSPVHESENDFSHSQNDLNDPVQVGPSRHSARTAGKTFKFAEASSEDDSVEVIRSISGGEKNEADLRSSAGKSISEDIESFSTSSEDTALCAKVSKELPHSSASATKSKDVARNKNSSLVQATITTLFKKKEEKVTAPKRKGKMVKE